MTRLRLAAAALLLVGLAGLVACSGDDDEAGGTPSPTATTVATTTTVPEADVQVQDPGAEPRRELRYRLAEGTSTLATFTTDLELEQERGGVRQRLDAPPVRQALEHRVASVANDGTATVESEVVALEVRAEGTGLTSAEVDELQRQLDPLARSTSTLQVGTRGEILGFEPAGADGGAEADAEAPDGAGDDLVAAVLGLAPVLPEEPLGLGARWEVVTEVELDGRTATVRRTYDLTALDDAGFSWELDLAIEGAGSFSGEASGTNRWDAPTGELTARIEGERWLDPDTLEPVAGPVADDPTSTTTTATTTPATGPTSTTEASSTTGSTAAPEVAPIRQELVLAYRATVAPPTAAAAPTTASTAPTGSAGGT